MIGDDLSKVSAEIIAIYSEQTILTLEQLKSEIVKGIFNNTPSAQEKSFNNGINFSIEIIDSYIKTLKNLILAIKEAENERS